MKKRITSLFLAAAIVSAGILQAGVQEAKSPAAEKYAAPLRKIFDYQKMFAPLDSALEKVYPVAIVEAKTFYVFEPVPDEKIYRLALTAPDTFDIPVGVRAAMPLSFWEGRMACVVTPEIFGQPDGYVFIFHEFVHCAQWYGGEQKLKEGLSIFQDAMQNKNYMWELQYPFPYTDPDFVGTYRDLLGAWERDDTAATAALRAKLYSALSPQEWEYMTWQEWKEGLARNLENKMRKAAGLPENLGGIKAPYSRVTFYVGGDKQIRYLERSGARGAKDLESLYRTISAKPDRR